MAGRLMYGQANYCTCNARSELWHVSPAYWKGLHYFYVRVEYDKKKLVLEAGQISVDKSQLFCEVVELAHFIVILSLSWSFWFKNAAP